ncbi:MAG TPA: hypothetical protein VK083_14380 [Nocardia sp.]|uniref:Rv0361 family membrane protein n=1 Tax=Nocardia TaxID=1817 RepID=UPI002454A1C9|nr:MULTISPECIES: hypothetical protein [Nocardia]HLS77967.1 hypothetical protein [Nocardia sp.]
MTDSEPSASDEPVIPIDQTDERSMTPFIAAAVVAALVLAGIVLGVIFAPAEKNVTEADRISAAVQNFVAGVDETGEIPPPGTACADFDAARFPLPAPQDSGKTIELKSVTDHTVNGDRAKATVTTSVDGVDRTGTWLLVRGERGWLICSA